MLIPIVFLLALPVAAAFIGLHQAWLTHVEEGYSAETAGGLMMLPWVPLLLGASAFVFVSATSLRPSLRDALSIAIGLAALGASVSAGLVNKIGLGELLGDPEHPWVTEGLTLPQVLTVSAIVAALVLLGLADLAVITVTNIAAATGVGAAAAGGAHFWGGNAFRIPKRELVAIAVAIAIISFLVFRALS